MPTKRPSKKREESLRQELSVQASSRSDLERSIELRWDAIRVVEEYDSGWGPTSVPSSELALVVAEHPIEMSKHLIEVPTSDEVMEASEELSLEEN